MNFYRFCYFMPSLCLPIFFQLDDVDLLETFYLKLKLVKHFVLGLAYYSNII